MHCYRNAERGGGRDHRRALRLSHVGEHAIQVEHDCLGRQYRVERAREPLEVRGITGQRNSQTRLETRATGEVAHENPSCAESVTDERRPRAEVGEYEVCLRGAGIDAT